MNRNKPRRSWHDGVFFGLHYDLHANAADSALGKELTAEHLSERLGRVMPDWVQCDCKGHAGYTSWPTQVGSTSPGVVNDSLAIHRQVTRALGIRLGMHYSGVWDSRAIELHGDWARLDAAGVPDKNQTCRLSPYADELMIPQMLELIDRYDVDGFWVDGENWASRPCWCQRCTGEFTRRTGLTDIPTQPGQPNWSAWLAFHRDLFVEHVARYADAVHARKSSCAVCSNWMYTIRQPEAVAAPVDYLSGDYDFAWGANRAALEGRLLDARGMSWDLMAWGFITAGNPWDPKRLGPPWQMKPAPHLCQELAEVVALGGAMMVYDNPQRTGWLTGWHQDTLAEVADFCRQRKELCFGSRSVSDSAVLHLAGHYYSCNDPLFNYGGAVAGVEGALHALLETHHSTDVLTEDSALERMGRYKLLVVPEQTHLSAAMQSALDAYAQAGGQVIMSGVHLASECPTLVGAEPAGVHGQRAQRDGAAAAADDFMDCVYLPCRGQAVATSGPWQAVRPLADTTPLVHCLLGHEPEKDRTNLPVVTYRRVGGGAILAIHGPVFRDYAAAHYPLLREFLRELIASLGIQWLATLESEHQTIRGPQPAPVRLEMILRQKAGRLRVNLINRGAAETLSPQRVTVEEIAPVTDIVLKVRRPERPRAVEVFPHDTQFNWEHAGGVLSVHLAQVYVHTVVSI